MKKVYAGILAGGQGTGLMPLTKKCAKPILPYGGSSSTLMLAINSLLVADIGQIDIYTQYQHDSIAEYVDTHWPELSACGRLMVIPPKLQDGYRGTADAVFHNLDRINEVGAKHVIITAADHACSTDWATFYNFHVNRGADLTIGVLPVNIKQAAKRFGVLEVDAKHKVLSFEEKPLEPKPMPHHADMALASTGKYCFKTGYLEEVLSHPWREVKKWHDFGKNIIPLSVESNAHVFAFYYVDKQGHPAYWRDLGRIKDYYDAQIEDLLGDSRVFEPDSRSVLSSTTNIINANFIGTSMMDSLIIGPGCKIYKSNISRSILSPGVVVHEGSMLNGVIAHENAVIGRNSHLERVIIGRGVKIPPETVIIPGRVLYNGEYFPGKNNIIVIV